MSFISVIIPVYNVETFLPRCLDSVLAQTYRDFQVLLINDGSCDNSAAICDRYAQIDSRIHVIHQENHGVSAVRNQGIELALQNDEIEWITFIDSDDYIHPKMLESLLEAAVSQKENISACSFLCTTDKLPYDNADSYISQVLSVGNFYMTKTVNLLFHGESSIVSMCLAMFDFQLACATRTSIQYIKHFFSTKI
jgi:glycosyltransferase involved in cell wall biosynthesis